MNKVENPVGFAEGLEQGSERQAELVAKAEKAEAQLTTSQLAEEGIVCCRGTN